MGWLATFFIKRGLGYVVPWLLPAAIGLLVGGGGLASWWNELSDNKTILLGMVTAAAIAGLIYVAVTIENQLVKTGAILLMALVLIVAAYYKGRIDEELLTDMKVEEAVEAVHARYRTETEAEKKRVEEINRQAREAGEQQRNEFRQEQARMRAELEAAKKEAADAKNAKRPSLDVDARKRLNRLRHNPRAPRVPGASYQARPGATACLDAPPLPAPTLPARGRETRVRTAGN